MALGILAVLGSIIHGISTVFTKTWEISKQFISWLIGVMPRPLRFLFFLYIILFLVGLIIPQFLGTSFACDSRGVPYKMNMFDIFEKTQYVDALAATCAHETDEIADVPKSVFSFSSLAEALQFVKTTTINLFRAFRVYQSVESGNYSYIQEDTELCREFREIVIANQTPTRDFILLQWGESLIQNDYKQTVSIGCTQNKEGEWHNTLTFFNIDVFNFELWLMLGILGLVPWAFRWYQVTIRD